MSDSSGTYKHQFEAILQRMDENLARLEHAQTEFGEIGGHLSQTTQSSSRSEASEAVGQLNSSKESLRKSSEAIKSAASAIEQYIQIV